MPALVMAIAQPVWSRVDEAAHYDVIAQYAAGVYPHDAVTTIRPQTLEVMERTGVYGFVVDNAYAKPDVGAGFQPVPSGLDNREHVLWMRRHGFQFSYEAFQPPLYYLLATPVWLAGDALGGAFGAVYAVRAFDALLAALLAPLSMLIALQLWPARRAASWAAALIAAVLPGVAVNLTSVTNDVLVCVLGAVCILVAMAGPWTRRRVVMLGLLFGAALLTKTTAVGILPALAVALLAKGRGGGVRQLGAVLAISTACAAPWLASNLWIYGELITTREQLAMSAFPARTADPSFWSVSTLHAFVTFWSGDPFLSLPAAVPLALLAAFLTALALAGLWHGRKSPEVVHSALAVVALAGAGAAVTSVASPLLAAFNAPGRLAYVALGPAVALVAVGLWFELASTRLRRAMVGTFCVVSVAGLALVAIPSAPVITDAGHPVPARTQALDAHGSLDGVRVDLLTCAVDTSGDTWLEMRILNTGDAAEWSQGVEVQAGGHTLATSDYRRSTPFPMALPPGIVVSGWLWLGPSDRLRGLADTTVLFRDVAAENYRSIGTVEVATPLC